MMKSFAQSMVAVTLQPSDRRSSRAPEGGFRMSAAYDAADRTDARGNRVQQAGHFRSPGSTSSCPRAALHTGQPNAFESPVMWVMIPPISTPAALNYSVSCTSAAGPAFISRTSCTVSPPPAPRTPTS